MHPSPILVHLTPPPLTLSWRLATPWSGLDTLAQIIYCFFGVYDLGWLFKDRVVGGLWVSLVWGVAADWKQDGVMARSILSLDFGLISIFLSGLLFNIGYRCCIIPSCYFYTVKQSIIPTSFW